MLKDFLKDTSHTTILIYCLANYVTVTYLLAILFLTQEAMENKIGLCRTPNNSASYDVSISIFRVPNFDAFHTIIAVVSAHLWGVLCGGNQC